MQLCSFCDRPADTKEHVIPQWLQRHFHLWDQQLGLWNETAISYRQSLIPACHFCNNQRFSRLENAVRTNDVSEQDLYLWALKIQYGLSLKDNTLLLDRKSPQLGPLLPREIATYGAPFVRHAFRALDNTQFRFNPFPFGSVFLFSHPNVEPGRFDFVDIPAPYWALAITLPQHRILAVLFADRGVIKRIMRRYTPLKTQIENLARHVPEAGARTILFQLLRWQMRLVIPSGVRLANEGVLSDRIPRKIRTRKPKLAWYRQIAANCGLPDAVAHQAFLRDKDAFQVPYLLCG